ncbi:hypothetical protein [Hymenobacter cellulosivorans]|uniref:Lipoprotein n=1 Tax=Hymenobacter cellulosivorans TaxID=2932249 RepID=A0ABY4FDP0_9BACT|nr:hypothetical protein [Hymenobacter cellulosivorans]UOQ54598.1 hypothetical protein MUN80_07495 [Hymenobacter cellulosivorans]
MKRISGLLPMLLLLFVGCQTANDTLPQFEMPVVLQPELLGGKTPAALRVDSIRGVWPQLVGRFQFAKHLELNKPDSLGADKYYLDSGQPFHGADTLNTDGLELIADYQSTTAYRNYSELLTRLAYPVYIVNSTPRTKLLCGKDFSVYAIQEAKDRTGEWRPIESRGPEPCGNGAWIMKIRPRQMAVLLFDKYQGCFKTMLRVRLRNGNSQYTSVAYEGWISETQFLATQQERRLLKKNNLAVSALYYGAWPAVLDTLVNRAN